MSGLVTAMALVVVTYGGTVSVNQNLDDHACSEARSVALYGKSVEQKADDDAAAAKARAQYEARLDAEQTEWERANPKQWASCKAKADTEHQPIVLGFGCGPNGWLTSSAYITNAPSAATVRYAECVK